MFENLIWNGICCSRPRGQCLRVSEKKMTNQAFRCILQLFTNGKFDMYELLSTFNFVLFTFFLAFVLQHVHKHTHPAMQFKVTHRNAPQCYIWVLTCWCCCCCCFGLFSVPLQHMIWPFIVLFTCDCGFVRFRLHFLIDYCCKKENWNATAVIHVKYDHKKKNIEFTWRIIKHQIKNDAECFFSWISQKPNSLYCC